MPIDRQTKQPEVKPVTPALSARFRSAKAPLVPRLASSAPSSPVVTARKDFRTQKLSPTTGGQTTTLIENITPRSGLRNTRIGTASPATPVSNNDVQSTDSPGQQSLNGNSPVSRPTGQYRLQGAGATSIAARRISGSSTISKKDDTSTKFFHAGNPKPVTGSPKLQNQTTTRPRPTSLVKTSSPARTLVATPPKTTTPESKDDGQGGKFFRANNISDPKSARPARPPISSKLSSTSAPVSRNKPSEIIRSTPNNSPHQSPRKNGSPGLFKAISPAKTPFTIPIQTTLSNSPTDRRNSISSAVSRMGHFSAHKKSASISTFSSAKSLASPSLPKLQIFEPPLAAVPNILPYQQPSLHIPQSPETISPRSASMASSKTGTTSVTSDTDHSEISKMMLATKDYQPDVSNTSVQPQSQPTPLAQAQANAANARRERKVLDLEISNSSLLAINKTLERELKKQSTELRRFRRLSRTGRLSFAPSKRSISGQSMLSTLSEHIHEDDDDEDLLSEDDSEQSDDDEIEPIGDSSLLSSTSSTTARARQRARDERRLMLDLTKHQQLLLDSQKMSQSIRKCLNFSEELIKEGKRAIEYSVGIGDIKLGGRVLSSEDYEDGTQTDLHSPVHEEAPSRRGLLSPSLTLVQLQEATGWLGAI